MTQLARVPEQETAIARPEDVNVAELLRTIVKHDITAESAAAVKELVLLQEHRQDRAAKQEFIRAFAAVRAKIKTVNTTKPIPDKNGNVKWFYAPLEDIQDEVEPVLQLEGLSIRFDSRREGNICTGICWLSHVAGHEEKAECAVNVANAEGGDLGALKKAKRGALVAILGIKTRHDNDAAVLGDFVSPEQAAELRRRLHAVGGDEGKFLAYAGAADFKQIRQGRLGQLHDFLHKKEKLMGNNSNPASAPNAEADAARSAQNAAAEAPHDAPAGTNEDLEIRATEIVDGLDEAGVRSMVIGFSREITKKLGPALGDKARPQDWRNRAIAGKVLQLSGMK